MEQPQQSYSTIGEEIRSKTWKLCNGDLEKITVILSTTSQQRLCLVNLLEKFDNKIDKTAILKTWRNCNRIYVDTQEKLREICATSSLHELKEENELKIKREMCLHILWNILKYPKHIKYRQISKQALYNYLFQKCHTLCADFEK
ncbi:hypothetical protein RFI_04881, partial [Reticulomyxa filosa]